MPDRSPVGPILKIATPVVLTAIPAVSIAAVWGLDWRWIPTTVLTGLAVMLAGGFVDAQLERRARRRMWEESPGGELGKQMQAAVDEILGKDRR